MNYLLRPSLIVSVIITACLLAWPPSAAAQDGEVSGTVSDTTGGVLPGVTVEALGPAGEFSVAVTDGEGRYSLTALAPGAYTVSFSLPGFERVERPGVEVTGSTPATVDAVLQIGGLFEQVTVAVTGTAIDAPAINMPAAVTLVSRQTLEQQGSTQLVDLFKNLSQSHGVIGERNSWYNSNQPATLTENVANVNLRGLGASRTLVLINGRRHVPVPARLIGGRFVDVNTIPAIAVGRLEVLKEGASATYGSDAVAGVANFVTRNDFRGFEANVSHDYFADAGDTTVAGIWGGRIGASSLVLSAERVGRQDLQMTERPWLLDRQTPFLPGSRSGWSSLGNPGTFAVGRPAAFTSDVFDPRCAELGGQPDPDPSVGVPWTCRFRYSPYDNLIEAQQQTRAFVELNGPINDRTNYHVEGLFANATIPDWYTTPSYPPFPVTNTTIQQVAPDHPGRLAFCGQYAGDALADPSGACAGSDNWYFNGRPFGNSGPARTLNRASRTFRLAGSVDGDFRIGERNANWDVGLTYSRARGNLSLPAVYTDRIFRAFRGYGGPNCGVGVVADPSSPAGMALGPLGGAQAGVGDCMYYNPFSNAVQYADQQLGAALLSTPNPDFVPGLANQEALRTWLNEEVDLVSTTDLFVADAIVSGNIVENVADFAVGYQFRQMRADGDPNGPGDFTVNPCPVAGDTDCSAGDRFGPYLFTNVHNPYEADQRVQRLFGELALSVGSRLDTQIAANYEFYNVAGRTVNSFDPKIGGRLQLAENLHYSLALRGSAQTTFRTPSLDDLNTSPLTTLEWIPQTGAYQAVDRYGSPDLLPERAFTYNAGVILFLESGIEATVDYWSYDFENVIGSMPYDAITSIYDTGAQADRNAVARFIICPDGRASDLAPAARCAASALERVQIDLVNWPGLTTSGIDTHVAARTDVGPGQLSASWDSTYTVSYETKALTLEGTSLELYRQREGAGYLNFASPIAVPLPRWKSRWSGTYSWDDYTLASYVNYIGSYKDRAGTREEPTASCANYHAAGSIGPCVIDSFLTWDASFLWRFPGAGIDVSIYGLNLTGARPPWVNVEQAYDGFTHDPKGRRLKLGVTYRFGR